MGFRVLPYVTSQGLWILYFAVPILLSMVFQMSNGGQMIVSAQSPEFRPDIDPIIFAHLTDIHVSTNDNSIPILEKLFEHVNQYVPDFVLITGDLCDNYDRGSAPRYSGQFEEYWKEYSRLISKLNSPVWDVAGNHDLWGVRTFSSPENFLLDYSSAYNRNNTKTYEDFVVKVMKHGSYTILLVNPFEFPTARCPMHVWICPGRRVLDLIETAIKQNNNVIIASHHPAGHWCDIARSSTGLTFRDMLELPNVLAHLTGHSHPEALSVQHLGKTGGLELVGPAALHTNDYGIVSIDNGKIAWTNVNSEDMDDVKVIVTHPVPKTQLSPRVNFAELNTEVRLVAFTDDILNITVSGDTVGLMKRTRKLSNGAWLYTCPLNISKGNENNEIHFSGDFTGSVEFTVAESYVADKVLAPENPRLIRVISCVLLPFYLVVLTIVLPGGCFSCVEAEQWIEGAECKSAWLASIFAGFFLLRVRFLRLPRPLRVIFVIAVLWPIALPIHFFNVEGIIGVIWSYGYVADGKAVLACYGWFWTFYYLVGTVVFPLVFATGTVVKPLKPTIARVIDNAWGVMAIVINLFFLIMVGFQCCGYFYAMLSPGFVWIPLMIYSSCIYYAFFFEGKPYYYDLDDASGQELEDNM